MSKMQANKPHIAYRFSNALCALPVIIASVSLFLMGLYHIPINDDIVYRYVFNDHGFDLISYSDPEPADSFDKIIDSQIFHYLHVNGRAIVHVIVQIFAGILGDRTYTVFAAILLAATITLFIRYACPTEYRHNPLVYALASASWLYLYPSPIGAFYWISFGMNYLYPMFIVLCFCLILRKVSRVGHTMSPWLYLPLSMLGFIVGWSHEGFAIPLSGATFFYAIFNFKRLDKASWCLIASLWVGTLLLFASPGNFNRIGSSIIAKIINSLYIFTRLRLLWVAVVFIIAARIMNPMQFRLRMKKYGIIWLATALGLIFGLIANTGPWSMMGTEFFASILMFSQIPSVFGRISISGSRLNALSIIILLLITIHQSAVITAAVKNKEYQLEFIADFQASPLGLARIHEYKPSPLVRPWIYDWHDQKNSGYVYNTISFLYGDKTKHLTALGEKDYEAIYNPDRFFTEDNHVAGDSPFYDGDLYYWAKTDQLTDSSTYLINYAPIRVAECPYLLLTIKAIIEPGAFPSKDIIKPNAIDTIMVNGVRLSKLRKATYRTVRAINTLNY